MADLAAFSAAASSSLSDDFLTRFLGVTSFLKEDQGRMPSFFFSPSEFTSPSVSWLDSIALASPSTACSPESSGDEGPLSALGASSDSVEVWSSAACSVDSAGLASAASFLLLFFLVESFFRPAPWNSFFSGLPWVLTFSWDESSSVSVVGFSSSAASGFSSSALSSAGAGVSSLPSASAAGSGLASSVVVAGRSSSLVSGSTLASTSPSSFTASVAISLPSLISSLISSSVAAAAAVSFSFSSSSLVFLMLAFFRKLEKRPPDRSFLKEDCVAS